MTKKSKIQLSANDLACEIAHIAKDRNCEDIVVIDVNDVSPITNCFVIATGTSDRQIRSLADELKSIGKKIGHPAWHIAGTDTAEWIVMDFVDVVVHLFVEDVREFYDLEMIWGQSPKLDWENYSPRIED